MFNLVALDTFSDFLVHFFYSEAMGEGEFLRNENRTNSLDHFLPIIYVLNYIAFGFILCLVISGLL